MPNNPMYGSNKFDSKVGERLYTEAGTGREHENSTDAADRECLTRYMYGYPEQFRITNISIEFCRIPLWVWL